MKNKPSIKFSWQWIPLILFLLFNLTLTAQNPNDGWTRIKEDNGVVFSCKTTACGNDTVILVKLENASNSSRTVSWNLWNGEPNGSYTIGANQTNSGSCANQQSALYVTIPENKTLGDLRPTINIQ
jgi:hypothetical protein